MADNGRTLTAAFTILREWAEEKNVNLLRVDLVVGTHSEAHGALVEVIREAGGDLPGGERGDLAERYVRGEQKILLGGLPVAIAHKGG